MVTSETENHDEVKINPDMFQKETLPPTSKPVRGRPPGTIGGLKTNDLCAIIETCSKCQVRKLSALGVTLEFREVSAVETFGQETGCLPVSETEPDCQGRHDLATLGDRVDEELEMLKITDPVLYEKYVADQEGK